jgi:hypothetical protein
MHLAASYSYASSGLILLNLSYTSIYLAILYISSVIYVSWYYYIRRRPRRLHCHGRLYMCPHTTIYVSSLFYVSCYYYTSVVRGGQEGCGRRRLVVSGCTCRPTHIDQLIRANTTSSPHSTILYDIYLLIIVLYRLRTRRDSLTIVCRRRRRQRAT